MGNQWIGLAWLLIFLTLMELLGHFHSLLFSAKHSNYDLKPIAAFSAGGRAANMEYLNITALLQGFQFWIQTTEKNPTKHIISQYAEKQYLVFQCTPLLRLSSGKGEATFGTCIFKTWILVLVCRGILGESPGLPVLGHCYSTFLALFWISLSDLGCFLV